MIEGFSRRAAVYLTEERNRLELRRYVDVYLAMMRLLPSVDPAADAAFRRLYNVFYKLRFAGSNGHTSADIYDGYYRLLYLYRDSADKPAVETVLSELYALTGRVHLSFSSKLIATLYPDSAPVWDDNVRALVGIPCVAGQLSDARRRTPIMRSRRAMPRFPARPGRRRSARCSTARFRTPQASPRGRRSIFCSGAWAAGGAVKRHRKG